VRGRWRRLVESRRERRVGDLRERLADDIDRTRAYMFATIIDARRVGAPVPPEIVTSVTAWANWVWHLRHWAVESEQ
jgi:hypothetical protein